MEQKKRFIKHPVLLAVIVLMILTLRIAYVRVDIGMTEWNMKNEAMDQRRDDWKFTGTTGHTMAAFIQYNEEKTAWDCQIYVKRPGAVGWFFRYGGGEPDLDTHVVKMALENNSDYALISMNSMGISEIEIRKDGEVTTQNVEPDKPFALVMSHDWGVVLYDAEGNVVEPLRRNI